MHPDEVRRRRRVGPSTEEPEREVTFLETVHGPVSGTVTVHGVPYAVARDRSTRGYSTEAVVDTILRRMPDYVNYICPQFSETHINFQRVPTVDTSNPVVARYIPTADESFVVIRFANPKGIDFPYLLSMIHDSFMSRPNIIVVPGGKMDLAMQLILTPLILKLMDERRRAVGAVGGRAKS